MISQWDANLLFGQFPRKIHEMGKKWATPSIPDMYSRALLGAHRKRGVTGSVFSKGFDWRDPNRSIIK